MLFRYSLQANTNAYNTRNNANQKPHRCNETYKHTDRDIRTEAYRQRHIDRGIKAEIHTDRGTQTEVHTGRGVQPTPRGWRVLMIQTRM